MDATAHTAIYHLQCDHYDKIKPPSFYDYPDLNSQFMTRDRERFRHSQNDDDFVEGNVESDRLTEPSSLPAKKTPRRSLDRTRSVARSINIVHDPKINPQKKKEQKRRGPHRVISALSRDDLALNTSQPTPLLGQEVFDGNWGPLFNDGKSTYFSPDNPNAAFDDRKGFASTSGGRTPPLFLQELAHLASLLVAVALSTLRNDIDGAESPLDLYEIGAPWPEVDYGKTSGLSIRERLTTNVWYFLGSGRTPEERTRYNALRPLPVIGGVSDKEIRYLQMARGPYAKTQLCWQWLSEFIIREHLAGSLGKVGAPIISRVVQFLSDGMTGYNQSRKIMFIPFPFVHGQLSVFFVVTMIFLVPLLMDQYTDSIWFGVLLTFLSVSCLSGIHEVARELENPFRNIPNELPVVTLMAEFNEALVTMYSGYHPDFFWDGNQNENSSANDLGRVFDSSHSTVDAQDSHLSDQNNSSHISEPSSNDEKLPPCDKDTEINLLKTIVDQQGRMMEKMMEEQLKMSRMVEQVLKNKNI